MRNLVIFVSMKRLRILTMFLWVACQNPANNKTPKEIAFEKYVKLIHPLHLPYTDTCEYPFYSQKIDLPDSMLDMFTPSYYCVIGKLEETDKYVAIIYRIDKSPEGPILKTFDMKGNQIQKMIIYNGFCYESDSASSICTVQITADKLIICKDSITKYKCTLPNDKTKMYLGKEIKLTFLKIDSLGHIYKMHRNE